MNGDVGVRSVPGNVTYKSIYITFTYFLYPGKGSTFWFQVELEILLKRKHGFDFNGSIVRLEEQDVLIRKVIQNYIEMWNGELYNRMYL